MNKDGAPSGYDIPIFGGSHGDLVLTEDMGEMLGRLIAMHDLSCVVDLSGFASQAAMRRFARDFATALYEHNTQPITLFVDEADQLAPQRVPAEMAKLLHAMETLIRLGRQRGIFMWMLTQRPQVLNKNLLSQAESLIAMKVTTPHDRGAIRDWMDAHDPDQAKEIEKQLAKLSVGEAFAWVPGADYLERVQFPLFRTYDSGRTPKHGETISDVELPTIDLSAVQAALASVGAEPEVPADPIEALKAGHAVDAALKERDDRIAELERERDALFHECKAQSETIERLMGTLAHVKRALRHVPDEPAGNAESTAKEPGTTETTERLRVTSTAVRRADTSEQAKDRQVGTAPAGALNASAVKMLDMLERIAPARVTWASLAAMIGNKARGGNFNAARKAMRESGRIIEDGDSVRSSTPAKQGMTRAEAYDLWHDVLANPAPRMMHALLNAPDGLTKQEIGEALEIAPRGGNFNHGIAQLIRNGVAIDHGGRLHLADPLPGESG